MAIRAEKGKVVDKLENYDAGEIAKIATDHGLYEEALTIYKKYDQHAMAINVLVEHIVSIDRGFDYASKVNRPEVWSRLAKAQLDGLRIKDSIGMQYFALSLNLELTFLSLADSYIKAEDPANFAEVIKISNRAGKHDDLVRFLQMARKPLREPRIDHYQDNCHYHTFTMTFPFLPVPNIPDQHDKMSTLNHLVYLPANAEYEFPTRIFARSC